MARIAKMYAISGIWIQEITEDELFSSNKLQTITNDGSLPFSSLSRIPFENFEEMTQEGSCGRKDSVLYNQS